MLDDIHDPSCVINHIRDIINVWSIGRPEGVGTELDKLRVELIQVGWEEWRILELMQLACFGTRFETQLPSLSMW